VANGALLNFTQPEQFAGGSPAAVRALDLLSVRDLLVGPGSTLHGPGLRVAYRGADGVVYANRRALPRVFVVDHQETVTGDDAALARVTAPGFDGRGVAVTSSPLPGIPQSATAPAPAGSSARLVRYDPERVVIDATTPTRGLLVLTDPVYPGWTATVDGHSVPVQRVDYLLRGVELGPGRHTIEFRYQPASFTIGWVVSLLALAGLSVAVVTAVAARRVKGRRRQVA
jgi:hypothetical protein